MRRQGSTILCGLLLGCVVPGGAQWCARRWAVGLVFFACGAVLAGFAAARFGWPVVLVASVTGLSEQLLWWRENRS